MDKKDDFEIDFSKKDVIDENSKKNEHQEFIKVLKFWKGTSITLGSLCSFFLLTVLVFIFFIKDKIDKDKIDLETSKCSFRGTSGTTVSDSDYCIPEPSKLPVSLWLGDPNIGCEYTPEDCNQFGFIYNGTHERGDANLRWCLSGTKIRCIPPPNPKDEITDANTLKVVSYNIFDLPYYLSSTGQRERSCRIPGWFAEHRPDVDAIALQEAFNARCYHMPLKDLFKHYGYRYSTDLVTDGRIMNGGLAIVSKWPITAAHFIVFKSAESFDKFSAKGANYARIVKSVNGKSRVYHLTNAHLQSSGANREAIRIQQTKEWAEMLRSLYIPSTEPLLFLGDFNIDIDRNEPLFSKALTALGAEIPYRIREPIKLTSDPEFNDVKRLSTRNKQILPRWLDYVLYSKQHNKPKYSTIEALDARVEKGMNISCWCSECFRLALEDYPPGLPKCNDDSAFLFSLSDHQPVLGYFIF